MKWISKYDAVREYATAFHDSDYQGYECDICGRIIKHEHNGTYQGMGYMLIAMESHMDKHIRHNEIPNISKITRNA